MIYLGKLLNKDDVRVFFYNNNSLYDPYYVSYTIIDNTCGKQEVIRQTENSKPMKFDTGSYFVPLYIHPRIFRVGQHVVKWSFQKYFDSQLQAATTEFTIVRDAFYKGEFCCEIYPKSTTINI